MTRFALAPDSLVRLLDDDRPIGDGHALVAPTLVRSAVLARVYSDVRSGRRSDAEGRALLERLAALKIRLLGDRVSRATAWRIAARLDWDDVLPAEHLAVASLQADALVTDDELLRHGAADLVAIAPYRDLFR